MRKIFCLGLAFFSLWLSGCGHAPRSSIQAITVVATADANHNAATAIDFVFVYDGAALARLPKTGPAWFAQKAALQNGLAASIDVVALQVTPASTVNVELPSSHTKAIAVLAFANYFSPDVQPVGTLTPYRKVNVQLENKRIVYSEH